jgi:hypothetical protein
MERSIRSATLNHVSHLDSLLNYIYINAKSLGKSTSDTHKFGEHVYILKHGPSSVLKHLKGVIYRLLERSHIVEAPLSTTPSMHDQIVTGSYSFSPKVFRVKLFRFIIVLY